MTLIRRNDKVVLLKDVTYTETDAGVEPDQHRPRSKKGDVSRALRILRNKGKVIVEGVNYRKRAVRPSADNPKGGWVRREMPIALSNVALWCPNCNHGVRARKVREGGKARRVCVKCAQDIPTP